MFIIEGNLRFHEVINFLKEAIDTSGKNPKPVFEHSLKVAEYLYSKGYGEDIVIGAILHDILEDTAVKSDEIKEKFGEKVANLVEACSFDEKIQDKVSQYQDLFDRCLKAGDSALFIKAADILDNSNYYHLAETTEKKTVLMQKMKKFIDLSRPVIQDTIVWRDLNVQYKSLQKKLLT